MRQKSSQSVLIIENDSAVSGHLSERLKKMGLYVITAKDGYEGYARACKEKPNIIISETLLSNVNGFRMSRLLKQDERYKNITIILMTSNNLASVNDIYQASGANQILHHEVPVLFVEHMARQAQLVQ